MLRSVNSVNSFSVCKHGRVYVSAAQCLKILEKKQSKEEEAEWKCSELNSWTVDEITQTIKINQVYFP